MTPPATIDAPAKTPAALPRLMTAEEHLRDHGDGRTELVRGRLEERSVPGVMHGETASRINRRLGDWADEAGLTTLVEAGQIVERGPDTVRLPDVSVVDKSLFPGGASPRGYSEVPFVLAVEVLSPDKSRGSLLPKVAEYAAAGTTLVWIVDPVKKTVEVFEDGRPAATYGDGDAIDGGDRLPEFRCEVRRFFGPA